MNKPPRNPATLREKSRRRLLRRIEKAKTSCFSAKESTMKVLDEGDLAYWRKAQAESQNRLTKMQDSYESKFPEHVTKLDVGEPKAPKAPKVKKPRAKKAA